MLLVNNIVQKILLDIHIDRSIKNKEFSLLSN